VRNWPNYFTHAYAHEAFEIKDAVLYWRERPRHHFSADYTHKSVNLELAGKKAGTIGAKYLTVWHRGSHLRAHRIIFLMHHGYLPEVVDHVNGDGFDNRIENLRPATGKTNAMNVRTSTRNKSGVRGVSFHKITGKWAAGVSIEGRWKYLGLFATVEEAAVVRNAVAARLYGEFFSAR
jgi:hypothetical protein